MFSPLHQVLLSFIVNHMDIIPGIFETDPKLIRHKIDLVNGASDWIQLDITDNTFVPVENCRDSKVLGEIIKDYPHKSFEAHLMVNNPEKYVKPLSDAGFKRLIAHIEANDIREFLEEAQFESVEVGIAIDASSELELIEPFLDQVDFVLVMTVEAGASGQPLLPETLEKVRTIRENYPDLPIEVDGGINDRTAKVVSEIGVTRAVATSYIFMDEPRAVRKIETLKQL
jgi:ribulose-phosphate 3-epimerase